MAGAATTLRAVLLAALTMLAFSEQTLAQEVTSNAAGDRVFLSGLDEDVAEAVQRNGELLAALPEGGYLTLSIIGSAETEDLVFEPNFPLAPNTSYTIIIDTGSEQLSFPLERPEKVGSLPQVVNVMPVVSTLPANALRAYVTFNMPMARSASMEAITLWDETGAQVENPFLNLGIELWTPDQTRLTLLFDPGRIKLGVGPNESHGAPFEEGRTYRLVIKGDLRDASGRAIEREFVQEFVAGPAERRAVDAAAWRLSRPLAGTREPLVIEFDRVMDPAIIPRSLTIKSSEQILDGSLETIGDRAIFTPEQPWSSNSVATLVVSPLLEDIAGNRICGAFDLVAGSALPCDKPTQVAVTIRE